MSEKTTVLTPDGIEEPDEGEENKETEPLGGLPPANFNIQSGERSKGFKTWR